MRYLFSNNFLHFITYMKCHVAKATANTECYSFPVRDLNRVNDASVGLKIPIVQLTITLNVHTERALCFIAG